MKERRDNKAASKDNDQEALRNRMKERRDNKDNFLYMVWC